MLLLTLFVLLLTATAAAYVAGSTRHRGRPKPAIAIVLAVATFAVATLPMSLPAEAQSADDPDALLAAGLVQLDTMEGGVLLLDSDVPGWYVPAPALHTDIDIAVSGPIARTVVTQRFYNGAEVFVEGKYLFPLPEGAAVDTLRMRVGNRWIQGTIEEREEARLIYEAAKEAGQVASLVEQQRPNTFSTSVANIAPDAEVIVQIEYQHSIAPRDGVFGLRLPLVVAPRYTPADQLAPKLVLRSTGWEIDTRDAEDAANVQVPVVDPRNDLSTLRNPVDISIDLDAGFPLGDVRSPYHDIDIERRIESSADIALSGLVPADRDFYLSWEPRELTEPYAEAFTELSQGDTHYITMLTPPSPDAIDDTRQPREIIFVQDTSGSMSGASIAQARAGLIVGLERLHEDDTFNIIEFNSVFTRFSRLPLAATDQNIARAVEWVDDLEATAGTEMKPALEAALRDNDANDGQLRQVIFLTDGGVSNELEMLQLIEQDLGESRLFTVGIGSAPNSYFMTAAARAGRGAFVYIGDLEEVADRMQSLFAKIETPAVVDINITDAPVSVDVSPFPIPDLYSGEPVVLTVRVPAGVEMDSLQLTGQQGSQDWSVDVGLEDAEIRPGISKLWAREHIRDLEALRVSPLLTGQQREVIDESILETAIDFSLVSRLTSLVAVDIEVTRPADADSASTDVPTNLPAGWDPETFFETDIDGDADSMLSDELLDRLSAADEARQSDVGEGGLPFAATGADWQLQALFGAGLIALGAAAFIATGSTAGRRRRA